VRGYAFCLSQNSNIPTISAFNESNYDERRQELFSKEKHLYHAYTMEGQGFTAQELEANQYLAKVRSEEHYVWQQQNMAVPELHFFRSKKMIESSSLFPLLQKVCSISQVCHFNLQRLNRFQKVPCCTHMLKECWTPTGN
jgi:hypothetical protein